MMIPPPYEPLTPDDMREACEAAPTLLESFFWGWLSGDLDSEHYFNELAITDLRGPGYLTDDFKGEA